MINKGFSKFMGRQYYKTILLPGIMILCLVPVYIFTFNFAPISRFLRFLQDPIHSQIGAQLNNGLSDQFGSDARGHFLGIGGGLLAQDLGANAQRALPPGYGQSNPGTPNFPAQGPRLPHSQGALSSQVQAQRTMFNNSATTSQQVLRFDRNAFAKKRVGASGPDIVYSPCRHIPDAPEALGTWPEEIHLNYTFAGDVHDLPDPSRSKVELHGNGHVTIGANVYMTITLYDRHGRKRRTGGDVVRAWLAEPSLGAAACAQVVDNNDGTYRAQFTAFWEGRPEVKTAIIMTREAVSTAFKRRYTCPPVILNTAVFHHPIDLSIAEETPCSFHPYISGYDVICNLTDDNFRRPWYCGKPRNSRLLCSDWTLSSERNLWELNIERQHMTSTELSLFSLNNNALLLKSGITLNVTSDASSHRFGTDRKCDARSLESLRDTSTPAGYLYEKKWYSKLCRSQFYFSQLTKYLRNVQMVIIGDSTQRQFFYEMRNLVTCEFTTDTWDLAGKHHEVRCENESLKFSLSYKLQELPFCTTNTPHRYYRPISMNLNEYNKADKLLIVLHGYAHFNNYHSHVFYEYVKEMKSTVEAILTSYPRSFIVIKGPHAFSFAKRTDHFIWMPDSYAAVYEKFVRDIFKDLKSDRLMFLDMMDITIATAQWHIHSEKFIIHEKLSEIFAFYSTYSDTASL